MPPKPAHIAQTSSEAKKLHKQNGHRLSEQQQMQIKRGHELDTRAARIREAKERRKEAKKKRKKQEQKEAEARAQTGVGLATQLVGYSHTQARSKSYMETFVGFSKPRAGQQRRTEAAMPKQPEQPAQPAEKEPWDDDDELALDLPQTNSSFGEQYADDDLDDDTLLGAHDIAMSDPLYVPALPPPVPSLPAVPPPPVPAVDSAEYIRLHGPINKAIERVLEQLPGAFLELLSHDISLKLPEWDPVPGLLHKLNPRGLPPHRLRIKVGSTVSLLRDLDTSRHLSKSQHLRVLRAENDRLECLVLDGQLQGTKTLLTRLPFQAGYRNDDAYLFQRTQFPIRVAVDVTPFSAPRGTSQAGFKLPVVPGLSRAKSVPKRLTATPTGSSISSKNPGFEKPGLPASASAHIALPSPPSAPSKTVALDDWDDFLESGTQIARELSTEPEPAARLHYLAKPASLVAKSLSPLSTQDFDFSIDELMDAEDTTQIKPCESDTRTALIQPKPFNPPAKPATVPLPLQRPQQPEARPDELRPQSAKVTAPKPFAKKFRMTAPPIDLSALTPSQMPRSVPDHHPKMSKRKAHTSPTAPSLPPAKRTMVQAARVPEAPKALTKKDRFDDFALSTQEVLSFFGDDADVLFGGSPPITV